MKAKSILFRCLCCLLFILTAVCPASTGRIIYVDDNGFADFNTIQAAIDNANDGNTVLVAPGTYTGDGNRDIDFKGKAITVKSEDGPETCIIDCQGTPEEPHRGFFFYNREDANSIVQGFTITNGYEIYGGGVRVYFSSPTLTNCIFRSNVAEEEGGGIYNRTQLYTLAVSNPILIDCTFSKNVAKQGGGMYNGGNSPILTNCTFSGNVADYGGGMCNMEGMYVIYDRSPTFNNCIFSGNIADHGGGMYNGYRNDSKLTNCTFIGNIADYGGGMCNGSSNNSILTNCTFSGNVAEKEGGGIFNSYDDNSILTNCTFIGNVAGHAGGGMRNYRNNFLLTDCTFGGNVSDYGGGLYNGYQSNFSLYNCMFNENSAEYGGGIYDDDNNNSIIYKCTFSKNNAQYGGGVFSEGWRSRKNELNFICCNFNGNSADYGGGINDVYTNLKLTNCIFSGNSANNCVGGIYNTRACNVIVVNCTFSGNLSALGNAIGCSSSEERSIVELTNCVLWNDNNEIWNSDGSTITIGYCDVKGGQANVYDPCEAVIWNLGNIDSDPCFADPGYWDLKSTPDDPNDDLWIDGDYHLKSKAGRFDPSTGSWVIDDVTSHCIDAGDPNSPVYYEPIPNGGMINMGAYGGIQQASMSLCDVNMILDPSREPNPANGITDVVLDILLSWVSDENTVIHEVYFGEENPPPFVRKQYETKFDPGALKANTQYYWRIDDIDNLLNRITGRQWTFFTGPKSFHAYNPCPTDGTNNVEFGAILTWNSGLNATAHNVYLGTDFNDVCDATTENPSGVLVSVGQDPNYYDPGRLEFNQTYYWRIDEIDNHNVITAGNVWMFITGSQPIQAYNPYPDNEAVNVKLDSLLSWSAGLYAVSHNVYLGTDFNNVREATVSNPMGVLVSIGQDSNSYDPVQLKYGRTYYWRIDEVDSQGKIIIGKIWSFTTSGGVKGVACFTSQTGVWVDGAVVPISEVAAGQSVSSLGTSGKVETVQEHEGSFVCYDILLESGNFLTVAENHFFMTESRQWLSLHDLKAGARLKTAKGTVGITNIKKRPEPYIGKVYNLKIEGSDRYMVGEDAVIVRDY